MSASNDAEWTERILGFLHAIGIQAFEHTLTEDTFLPGLRICAGRIAWDRNRLHWPGDLLHEAGHLAVMPESLRQSLDGSLHEIESVPHAGELEAMAWAYAACLAIAMPTALLFHSGGYQGAGQGLAFTYSMGVYPGLQGLAASGMALTASQAQAHGEQAYPHMRRWLREG